MKGNTMKLTPSLKEYKEWLQDNPYATANDIVATFGVDNPYDIVYRLREAGVSVVGRKGRSGQKYLIAPLPSNSMASVYSMFGSRVLNG